MPRPPVTRRLVALSVDGLRDEHRISVILKHVAQYRFTEYFENRVLVKRSYLTKELCIRVVEAPIRFEPQEANRYRFWRQVPELEGKFLRVVTLDDKMTIHNAFLDRPFKL